MAWSDQPGVDEKTAHELLDKAWEATLPYMKEGAYFKPTLDINEDALHQEPEPNGKAILIPPHLLDAVSQKQLLALFISSCVAYVDRGLFVKDNYSPGEIQTQTYNGDRQAMKLIAEAQETLGITPDDLKSALRVAAAIDPHPLMIKLVSLPVISLIQVPPGSQARLNKLGRDELLNKVVGSIGLHNTPARSF